MITSTGTNDLRPLHVRELRELSHTKPSGKRQGRPVLIGRITLVPALVSGCRVRDYKRARVRLERHSIVLGRRVVDTLVFGPCVAGWRVTFCYARNLDVDSWVEYDFFECLPDY